MVLSFSRCIPVLIIVAALIAREVQADDFVFTSDVISCITKEKCSDQYRQCHQDNECSSLLNAQSECRVRTHCNQDSRMIWSTSCYLSCIQETNNSNYAAITACSRSSCKATSQRLVSHLILLFAILIALSI